MSQGGQPSANQVSGRLAIGLTTSASAITGGAGIDFSLFGGAEFKSEFPFIAGAGAGGTFTAGFGNAGIGRAVGAELDFDLVGVFFAENFDVLSDPKTVTIDVNPPLRARNEINYPVFPCDSSVISHDFGKVIFLRCLILLSLRLFTASGTLDVRGFAVSVDPGIGFSATHGGIGGLLRFFGEEPQ